MDNSRVQQDMKDLVITITENESHFSQVEIERCYKNLIALALYDLSCKIQILTEKLEKRLIDLSSEISSE